MTSYDMLLSPQTVDKGDSVDVKYTGWIFDNGIGKVSLPLHHNYIIYGMIVVTEI